MSIGSKVSIEGAQALLRDIGMDAERSNARSAMVLLALASLEPGDLWSMAANEMQGTRAIMDWIARAFEVEYKPNTRETICRFTLHQFVQSGIVEENADDPQRPINSPKWNYRLTEPILNLMRSYADEDYEQKRVSFLSEMTTWAERIAERRDIEKVPVTLPNGMEIGLSAGGQNVLIKAVIEEFCPRFAPAAHVLYVGDTGKRKTNIESETLNRIGVVLPERGKEPDLIAWNAEKEWLYLIEACASHGPVDVTRKAELQAQFGRFGYDLIFISCFPSRNVMKKYLADLAWETEAWCADCPDHIIHLDGNKIVEPY